MDAILHMLKNKTFAGEEIADIEDMKCDFLKSIDDAAMVS